MTSIEKKELVEQFEKKPLQSKKFIAFLFMEILLCSLAIVALFTQPQLGWPLATFMSLIVMTMGAIALTFNGYQAALDKYFRAAAISGYIADKAGAVVAAVDSGSEGGEP